MAVTCSAGIYYAVIMVNMRAPVQITRRLIQVHVILQQETADNNSPLAIRLPVADQIPWVEQDAA